MDLGREPTVRVTPGGPIPQNPAANSEQTGSAQSSGAAPNPQKKSYVILLKGIENVNDFRRSRRLGMQTVLKLSGVRTNIISVTRNDDLFIKVDSRSDATKLLNTNWSKDLQGKSELGISAREGTPRSDLMRTHTKAILKFIPGSYSLNDVKLVLEENNVVSKSVRIFWGPRRAKYKTAEIIFEDNYQLSKALTDHRVLVDTFADRDMTMEEYVFLPKHSKCSKCHAFGHPASKCKNKQNSVCQKCQRDHKTADCFQDFYSCRNCKGDHPPTDHRCPVWIAFKESKQQAIKSKKDTWADKVKNVRTAVKHNNFHILAAPQVSSGSRSNRVNANKSYAQAGRQMGRQPHQAAHTRPARQTDSRPARNQPSSEVAGDQVAHKDVQTSNQGRRRQTRNQTGRRRIRAQNRRTRPADIGGDGGNSMLYENHDINDMPSDDDIMVTADEAPPTRRNPHQTLRELEHDQSVLVNSIAELESRINQHLTSLRGEANQVEAEREEIAHADDYSTGQEETKRTETIAKNSLADILEMYVRDIKAISSKVYRLGNVIEETRRELPAEPRTYGQW
jgi:hypothetical protein